MLSQLKYARFIHKIFILHDGGFISNPRMSFLWFFQAAHHNSTPLVHTIFRAHQLKPLHCKNCDLNGQNNQ
jgi:hypothetical protein